MSLENVAEQAPDILLEDAERELNIVYNAVSICEAVKESSWRFNGITPERIANLMEKCFEIAEYHIDMIHGTLPD